MAVIVRPMVRHSSKRKSIVVQILRNAQQCFHKIGAAKVATQIAKELITARAVPHVLNDGASLDVCVCFPQIARGYSGKSR